MKKTLLVALVIASLVFGIVAYASAASDSKTLTINARVNPKFVLTVTPSGGAPDLDWTGVDVGATKSQTVAVSIDSNRTGTLSVGWAPGYEPGAAWNLTNSLPASQSFDKKADNSYTDTITFKPDYGTPSLDTATEFRLQYSAVQG